MTLRKAIEKTCLTMLQLDTFLKETEPIINSRPLIYLSEDLNDRTAFTPIHFLSSNPKTGTALIQNDNNIADPTNLPAKISSKRHFPTPGRKDRIYWKDFGRFGDNYLMDLQERSQINLKSP